jgi:aminopeptidase YwaD
MHHRLVTFALSVGTLAATIRLTAQPAPTVPAETLLDRATLQALDNELSGAAAKDHVYRLAQMHRVPASTGFHEAIEYVTSRARMFGLSDVHVETFPGDGTTWFGTLHGNRGWRVEGGALDEIRPQPRRIASYDDVRLAVADNSESADVTTELVDVGRGADKRDYEGKDVRGKLVLCDAVPSACHRLAVEELGAAGLVSYNSNQVSAWWRDNPDLIRWGHLDARGRRNAFAIMISLREARSLQQRLARGERITLHAVVRARNDDAMPYETAVATIPGTDPAAGDIVFSCHLDHEKPGANDNASGCSANLEIARTLKTLIEAKRIPPPQRTIRFIWPSEMTGTIAYLTKYPDMAARIKAAVHLDMVGGDPFITKSVLHVTRSPWSIATVTDDVEEVFGRYVIDGAMRAAGDGDMSRAIRSAGGARDAFFADITPYESGSDHWIYQEGAFGIPSIYLRDHPDIYIHTTGDLPDNIEPTKIKRSAFIAAASGYYLATFPNSSTALVPLSYANALARLGEDGRRALARVSVSPREAAIVIGQAVQREQRRLASLGTFVHADPGRALDLARNLSDTGTRLLMTFMSKADAERFAAAGFQMPPGDARIPVRSRSIKGPLAPGGEWLAEKAGADAGRIAIARIDNADDVTYEIVNFMNGERSVSEIRDAVSAEFEPVDVKIVAEYIDLLVRTGAVTFK